MYAPEKRSPLIFLISYIYIPLGGTRNVVPTTVLVFSFVALWHDLSFRLLAWGWLVSLFILPEVAARFLLPSAKVYSDFVDPVTFTDLTRADVSMI